VCIDRSVARSTCKILAVFVGYVLTFWVLITLSQSKIDDKYLVFSRLIATDQEIIRLYITMNDSLFMNFLNSLDHLYSYQKYSF
jgi:cell division septal protein FtsQ